MMYWRRTARFPFLGVLAVTALAFSMACGPSTAPPASSSSPSPEAKAATPKRGGTLVQLQSTNIQLDATRNASYNALHAYGQIHPTLLQYSPQERDRIEGGVAASWEVSPDSLTYTFKIREGLKTYKGKPFGTEDVVYSIQRALQPPNKIPMPRTGCLRAVVKDVQAPNATTVVITLKDRSASFLSCIASPYGFIQPKYVLEEIDGPGKGRALKLEEVDGVGPFKLVKHTPGSLFEFERNESYFKPELPYLDKVQIVDIPDLSSQIAAFRTGTAHITATFSTPSHSEMESLKAELGDKVQFIEAVPPGWRGFQANYRRAPLNDKRLREAIHLALNRQDINALLMENEGKISAPYQGSWAWIYSYDEMAQWPGYRKDKTQDLARAKQLVQEAGFGPNNPVTVEVSCGTETPDECEILTENLKPIGITTRLIREDTNTRLARAQKGDFDLYPDSKGIAFDDPEAYNGDYYLPSAGLNFVKWENAEWLRLYEQQRRELDQAKRGPILRQMGKLWFEDYVFLATLRISTHPGHWSFVKGYVPPPTLVHVNYSFENVWLDK
ncbi:MAG: ABC transporter substrate-binding protein [Chloroflexi bacterium]|nr:ABC transporter substrate-binding protein [Chloroflexota bacterium]